MYWNFEHWRRMFKLWVPPLLGILAMVLLAFWFEVARFFLFVHHLFYIITAFLLINPVSETFWPGPESKKKEKSKRILPQPSAKARARIEAHKLMEKQKLPSAPAERLARLLKEKEVVDQKIEKLSNREKEHVK